MFLYISDRTQMALFMQKALSEKGFFLLHCPIETAEFICEKKDTGGIVLDGISDLKRAESLCDRLHALYPLLPIAVIVSANSIPNLTADALIRDTDDTTALIDSISDFFTRSCHWISGALTTYSLSLDPHTLRVYYMGYPLPLSKTEFRVLHCLFYRSPSVTATDDLMELCFPGVHRSVSNLLLRIRQINSHASKIDPRPLIIKEHGGYRLRNGIVE